MYDIQLLLTIIPFGLPFKKHLLHKASSISDLFLKSLDTHGGIKVLNLLTKINCMLHLTNDNVKYRKYIASEIGSAISDLIRSILTQHMNTYWGSGTLL